MNPLKLEFWAKNKYNAIFEGYHGTGKTQSVKELFNKLYGEQGVDWLYFSAATMDAWVDFVGVPREVTDADGTRYLELVRPRALAKDSVKAIFFDEFNRAPAKTRNAVMELLQFKSINGKRFNNLEIIWAAINPDDDDLYDVERIDPAQKDRFDVYVKVPYDVNRVWFFEKYGKTGEAACDWWRGQEEEIRHNISPRRLETVIKMYNDNGDIMDVLPQEGVNPEELIQHLQDGSFIDRLHNLIVTNNVAAAREALVNENFYNGVEREILNVSKHETKYIQFFVPLMPAEKIAKVINANQQARDWMISYEPYKTYAHIFDPIIAINSTKEEREKNGINTSTISRLKQWKRNSGGDDLLTDIDYIDMVSDSRMNIEFFKNIDERTSMTGRLARILDADIGLTKVDYMKILGPLVQIYSHSDNADSTATCKKYIKRVGNLLESKHKTILYDALTNSLPGLRSLSNANAFNTTKAALVKEGVVNEPNIV